MKKNKLKKLLKSKLVFKGKKKKTKKSLLDVY